MSQDNTTKDDGRLQLAAQSIGNHLNAITRLFKVEPKMTLVIRIKKDATVSGEEESMVFSNDPTLDKAIDALQKHKDENPNGQEIIVP